MLQFCLDRINARFAAAAAAHARFKVERPECLIAFHFHGNIYATFGADARLASLVLGIDLSPDHTAQPTCIFGEDGTDDDLERLVAAGHRVAVCESE